jgi:SNF2 family DNA or RNA helicase
MEPCDLVCQYYEFPFTFYPYQTRTINTLAPLPRSGWYPDMGLGKTAMATAAALFKTLCGEVERILIIVPPILLTAWNRFLSQVRDRETGPLDVLIYRGNPRERAALSLAHDVVVVGLQIFKRDYARFLEEYKHTRTAIIVDEAHALKNAGSDNHRSISALADTEGKHLLLLTGTPINSPIDAYGMIRLVTPDLYRSQYQFEVIHVAERDYYDHPLTWGNLDLLAENLMLNSVRLLKEDVLSELPSITYQPLVYELKPEHYRLYRKLAEEHVLTWESQGGKLDATSLVALLHALGQIICNWAYYAQDAKKVSNGFLLAEEILDDLGEGKLVLFANYRRTNREAARILAHYRPALIFGDTPGTKRDEELDRFVEDPTCRLFIGNPRSAGYGIDRLQNVSSTVLFLEPTVSVVDFIQALSRVHRLGQTKPVLVYLAVAAGTLQEDQVRALIAKEDLVQKLTQGRRSLREALGL